MSWVVMSFLATPSKETPETERVMALGTAKLRETGEKMLRDEALGFWSDHRDMGASMIALTSEQVAPPAAAAIRVDVPMSPSEVLVVYFVLSQVSRQPSLVKENTQYSEASSLPPSEETPK